MKVKISDKFISFPPYISTTWENIKSIRIEPQSTSPEFLVLTLNDGYRVKIPEVEPQLSQKIFEAHLRFIEGKTEAINPFESKLQLPIKMGISGLSGFGGLETMSSALQHNQAQSNMPDLPQEILNKIKSLSQFLSKEDAEFLPKAEPHCNCMHCQLARAISSEKESNAIEEEEVISEEDLRFRSWDIEQSGDKLYTVKNPLDHQEQYNVYLGDPIGCTCGQKNCEHLKAVLNT